MKQFGLKIVYPFGRVGLVVWCCFLEGRVSLGRTFDGDLRGGEGVSRLLEDGIMGFG
jgi:hypothetical protein